MSARLIFVAAALLAVGVAAGSAVADLRSVGTPGARPVPVPSAASVVPEPSGRAGTLPPTTPLAVAERGSGTFAYAVTEGPVRGRAGTLRRYLVAVEGSAGSDPTTFADAVDAVLGDPRSWIAGGGVRFQRAAHGTAADFTVFLATPATSEAMCATAGLRTQRFSSCRLPGKVIINAARWTTAVPNYGAPLAEYRSYVINHEVGHQLGRGHEACPGPGRPAPVMQQQTYGLRGCVANGWPYVDGRLYQGRRIS